MATDQPSELSVELLNDFYAECDEHLTVVRQSLASLETAPKDGVLPLIEKLFRSFHSLKGIIGMVGITTAERLAHRTEDYLRALSKQQVVLSADGIDSLSRSTQVIEQTVAAFRNKEALPDTAAAIDAINAIIPNTTAATAEPILATKSSGDAKVDAKISEAIAKGLGVWKATFAPTPSLNERGINVTSVRERIGAMGEIIHAAPRIGGGVMVFEFFVAAAQAPSDLGQWQESGVNFEEIAPASEFAETTSAAPAATSAPAPANLFVAPSQFVRVELSRLDDLMRVAGELVIQRARLEAQINKLETRSGIDTRGLQEVNTGFNRQFRELRETVMRLRMVPIAEIFDRLPFVVRDLTRGSAKNVRLAIHGQHTELDKFVVEQLKDPLLHLVRNAISHGIEDADERLRAGKPAEAVLTLTAKTAGETVLIEIADDGRGVDKEKVIQRARAIGAPVSDYMDNAALLDLLCLPGFSTKDEADRAAGRGVGMSVVATKVRELGGSLSLDFVPGQGTTFLLRLPVTLLITDALIVSTADQQFAVPQSSVDEVLHIDEDNVKRMERAELVSVRGTALPLIRLRRLFGFPKSDRKMPSVLVSQTDRGRVGLVVDRIVGQRQVVIRSLRDPLIHVPGVVGATELGDGRPLLILDPITLARRSADDVVTESSTRR